MKHQDTISFSILVPAYNAEQFLAECIESALNQSYKDFEIILVDDGSCDGTAGICDNYAAQHMNISVYHIENHGQIYAREFAMQRAKGDFFIFLDADDRLRSNALEAIRDTIIEHQCDCVIFGYARLTESGIIPMPDEEFEEILTNKRDIYFRGLNGKYNAIWRKAASATIWSQVTSDSKLFKIRMGEDIIQSISVYKNSNRIAFIRDILYEYRENPNGITHTISYNAFRESMGVSEMVYGFLKREEVFDEKDYDTFRQQCMEKHVDDLLYICSLNASEADRMHLLKKLRQTDYFKTFVNCGRTKHMTFRRKIIFLLSRWGCDAGILCMAKIYHKYLKLNVKKN